ncbi:TPM domain-containing protein [Mesonia sp. K7]|uniref:TPM domain-containing protein n=1 Tax=Mesonia sp. K7 TaxID=2218606 RepID=UPI000DA778F7|nr:TPM domain-containing protein [Mesonia sp. K7]PZD78698.1 TPM domain-containing protein [Mesonia sp. K7]
MGKIEDFLTPTEEQEIITAIRNAEENTSGEIRVHIENHCETTLESRTKEVFHYLKMDNTKLQNGVLIYVAVNDKKFYIYGDKGINDAVTDDFWESTKEVMQNHFRHGHFKQGLVEGIEKAGLELQKYFPWDHSDINELPNTISKENNAK